VKKNKNIYYGELKIMIKKKRTNNIYDNKRDDIIEKVCLFGKAISDPKRVDMIRMFAENKRCYEKADGSRVEDLEERPEGICVCNFVDALDMAQSKVSYHIKVLKEAGLIKETVAGKWRYYSINCNKLNEMIEILKSFKQEMK
jgi:ArsR family transcriptional regulator